MILKPSIKFLEEKKLIGASIKTNLIQNKTATLWRGFMGSRHQISGTISDDLFSLQLYPKDYFKSFSPATHFIKWAAKEVSSIENIPSTMQSFILVGGMYAVFDYKGSSDDHTIYDVIFTEWLPNSDYVLDNRPHFEILGEKYKNSDENSEEQIWIPIKHK
ncbi:MAG: GyrI-like domain-containing protein [Flavobacteriaceae bacterium]|nr:MAG: GyrI-like domain-containing protein [Flavobacteriaceae bacterium]